MNERAPIKRRRTAKDALPAHSELTMGLEEARGILSKVAETNPDNYSYLGDLLSIEGVEGEKIALAYLTVADDIITKEQVGVTSGFAGRIDPVHGEALPRRENRVELGQGYKRVRVIYESLAKSRRKKPQITPRSIDMIYWREEDPKMKWHAASFLLPFKPDEDKIEPTMWVHPVSGSQIPDRYLRYQGVRVEIPDSRFPSRLEPEDIRWWVRGMVWTASNLVDWNSIGIHLQPLLTPEGKLYDTVIPVASKNDLHQSPPLSS